MTPKRPSVPRMEVIGGGMTPTTTVAKPTPVNEKVTLYLTPELLAQVDEMRIALQRAGVRVDRSRLIRDALRITLLDSAAELRATLARPEDGADG